MFSEDLEPGNQSIDLDEISLQQPSDKCGEPILSPFLSVTVSHALTD